MATSKGVKPTRSFASIPSGEGLMRLVSLTRLGKKLSFILSVSLFFFFFFLVSQRWLIQLKHDMFTLRYRTFVDKMTKCSSLHVYEKKPLSTDRTLTKARVLS